MLPKLRFGLISKFKFQSIFAKTMIMLLISILLISFGVYSLLSGLLVSSYKEASATAQELILSGVSASLDTSLDRMTRNMNRLFMDQNVTGLMISFNRYDYERLVHVMDALFSLEEQDTLIMQAHLYVFGNDMVYSSDGEVGTIVDHKDKDCIVSCLTAKDQIHSFSIEDRTSGLLEMDQRLFLFQKYPNARPIGILIVELDAELLYQQGVGTEQEGQYVVSFYDQNFSPLFVQTEQQEDDWKSRVSKTGFSFYETGSITTYSYHSAQSDLTMVTQLSNQEILPDMHTIWKFSIPYLVVMVAAILLLALYLIWNIYKPIQDVIYSIASSGNGESQGQNEIEFLRTTYNDREEKVHILSGVLSEVSPAVTDRVFRSLISEQPARMEELESMLRCISSPFQLDAYYIVIFMRLRTDTEETQDVLAKEIHTIWFLNLCNDYWKSRFNCSASRKT